MICTRFSTTNPACMSSEKSTEAPAYKALDTIVLSQNEKAYCSRKAEAVNKSALLTSTTTYLTYNDSINCCTCGSGNCAFLIRLTHTSLITSGLAITGPLASSS